MTWLLTDTAVHLVAHPDYALLFKTLFYKTRAATPDCSGVSYCRQLINNTVLVFLCDFLGVLLIKKHFTVIHRSTAVNRFIVELLNEA